jgi:hypothetical protein
LRSCAIAFGNPQDDEAEKPTNELISLMLVIPAKAGISCDRLQIPASAGTTLLKKTTNELIGNEIRSKINPSF